LKRDGAEPTVGDANKVEALSLSATPRIADDAQPQTPTEESPYTDLLQLPGNQTPESFLDKLLEENYRGQAESFVRVSSKASARSLSLSQAASRAPSFTSRAPSSTYTPTRKSSKEDNQTLDLFQSIRSLRTPSSASIASRVIIEPYRIHSSGDSKHSQSRSNFSQDEAAPASPHSAYGHRVYRFPQLPPLPPTIPKRTTRSFAPIRGPFYFTGQERQAIADLVHENSHECDRHPNCAECLNVEYAYHENKIMPTSMPPEERQKIINNNRSLRNIKNVCIAVPSTDDRVADNCRHKHRISLAQLV
jgi:hypothetical protein